MAETRPEEIVKLLKADPAGEREAILQYLQHAWSMSDVLESVALRVKRPQAVCTLE